MRLKKGANLHPPTGIKTNFVPNLYQNRFSGLAANYKYNTDSKNETCIVIAFLEKNSMYFYVILVSLTNLKNSNIRLWAPRCKLRMQPSKWWWWKLLSKNKVDILHIGTRRNNAVSKDLQIVFVNSSQCCILSPKPTFRSNTTYLLRAVNEYNPHS